MSKYDIILDVYENQSISKAAAKHNYTQSVIMKKKSGLNYLSVPKTEWNHYPEQNLFLPS